MNILDEKRKGEIAYKVLLYKAKKEGVTIGQTTKRALGNVAKALGIPIEELMEFAREAMEELTSMTLP